MMSHRSNINHRVAWLVVCLMSLSGCIARYETVYLYTPPEVDAKVCLDLCQRARQHCLRNDQHHGKAHQQAAAGSPEHHRCDASYRDCYRLCGGQVQAERRCVAGCR